MSEHSTHCRDPHCFGCSCTPDCDYWDEEPNVMAERERIITLLETEAKAISDQFADYIESDFIHAIIELIKGENNG